MIRVEAVTSGRKGFILAIEASDREPGAGYDWDASGTALVVGQMFRSSDDGKPERWTTWLWNQAGQYPPRGQHADALSVPGPPHETERKLGKRHQAQGAWWTVSTP